MQLRYYQKEAKEAVIEELVYANRHSTLLVMATASGKTITFSHLIKDYIDAGKRVLVVAHREELIQQAHDKISDVTGLTNFEISVEKADQHAHLFSRVIVASIQSLKGERLRFWRRNHFALIVIDEAHHTVAQSYLQLIEHFNTAKVLGVTATPKRLDKKGLGQIFDSVAYVYPLQKGIKDGFLSPIIRKEVLIEHLDLSKVRKVRGDFSESDLEKQLVQKPTLYEVAKPAIDLSGDRATIVFCVTVSHAKQLCEVINIIKPDSAEYLHAKDTPERRREVLDRFREGKIQYLCNCLLFTEGVDLPFVSCIVCARPTQSESMYSQFIGRGLRICEGKENCLIIDFTDNSRKYNLVSCEDILGEEEEEEVKIHDKVFIPKEEEILAQAEEENKDNTPNEDLVFEKQRALTKEEIRFRTREINPFTIIGIYITHPKIGGIPPTEKQKDYITKHGLWRDDLTKRQASMICQKISERIKGGYCTPTQARILAQFGFDPNYTYDQASALITEIKANGWKLTTKMETQKEIDKMDLKTFKTTGKRLSAVTKQLLSPSLRDTSIPNKP